ncbi:MAG: NAD(P)/FAD-dependent oxidoreductase [Butyrivibrio sp.]|nr:NAD(P)/FAD-dependent oxidoreductase [Acetatifactor muris]MCM1559371.1 NAD(P)/FAD-dependent oxidoreductase [Butyrivibrio sp.]
MMYDLAVIGGGPAGYSAAFEALRHDKKVVLFEAGLVGGTCLNRGCVPTKYLSHVANQLSSWHKAEEYGIGMEQVSFDYRKSWGNMQSKIRQLRDGLSDALRSGNVDLVMGNALIEDCHTVACAGNEYTVEKILICTGTKPDMPFGVPGNFMTSDELLKRKSVPGTLAVLGGGVVAVEFAHIFAAFGSKVTMFIRRERILRGWDKEIAIGLSSRLKKSGVEIKAKCTQGEMFAAKAEAVLCALGRKPDIDTEAFRRLGIKADDGILADENGRTSVENIYAAGDVISGSVRLAHDAMYQGERAVRSMFLGVQREPAPVTVKCIYAGMEAASAGLTLDEAKVRGINAVAAKQTMGGNARTLIASGEREFIKLVADADKNVLIGAHILCERAGDIVSELALAMNCGVPVSELIRSVRPHPSYCEEITVALKGLQTKR